ncbi:hypothetical protein HN51_036487, partial [Arachis hypogaea]
SVSITSNHRYGATAPSPPSPCLSPNPPALLRSHLASPPLAAYVLLVSLSLLRSRFYHELASTAQALTPSHRTRLRRLKLLPS